MTEENIKVYILNEEKDEYDDVYCQRLFDKDSQRKVFTVANLCECPEDATIGRSLFDVDDFLLAVRRGIDLAKQGYTNVVIKEDGES